MDLDKELEADNKRQHRMLQKLMWYHGSINRNLAEMMFSKVHKVDGMFLVRKSQMCPVDFVLSLCFEGKIHHFMIEEVSGDHCYQVAKGQIIEGMDKLIVHYSEAEHGLPCRLFQPCQKAELPPPLSVLAGYTNILHSVTQSGDRVLVERVLNHPKCPDVNWKNETGSTAMHQACIQGNEDIVKQLLHKQADVNALDSHGYTPLHRACQQNHASLVQLLLKTGKTNPQKPQRPSCNVALHEAAVRGHLQTVKVMLSFDVPAWPRNYKDQSPYELAFKKSHYKCSEMIDKYEPPPAKTTDKHWFHPQLDRQGAIKLLTELGMQDGYFLMRPSSRGQDQFVLNVCYKNKINNHMIDTHTHSGKAVYFMSVGPYFSSLEHFVQHYTLYSDGMHGLLLYAVGTDDQIRSMETMSIVQPMNTRQDPSLIYDDVEAVRKRLPSIPQRLWSPAGEQYMKIKPEELELGSELGQGEYGSVLRGTWTTGGGKHNVAIKTLNEDDIGNTKEVFLREAEVMVKFNHPCIVRLIGVCEGPPLMLIQELLPNGSLQDFLLDYPKRIDTRRDLVRWAAQVAYGMSYLESMKFVHRDLATRNILLHSKMQAKVGDFGLSRAVGENDYYKATKGGRWPVKWYAPECMYYGTFSHASDVWSFGVTLWEMFTLGEQPYGDKTGAEVVAMIERNNRLEQPELCPDDVYGIMRKCWELEPRDRPKFSNLYDFFTRKSQYINISIPSK